MGRHTSGFGLYNDPGNIRRAMFLLTAVIAIAFGMAMGIELARVMMVFPTVVVAAVLVVGVVTLMYYNIL